MSKGQAGKKTKRRVPKVRSYVRPTRVHTPKPKKKPKYPGKEIEDGLGDLLNNCTLNSLFRDPFEGLYRFVQHAGRGRWDCLGAMWE